MGGCASIHHQNPPPFAGKPHNKSREVLILLSGSKQKKAHLSSSAPLPEPLPPPRRPAVVKVICDDGSVEEFKPPVTATQAAAAASGDGGGYLCSWESMYVDTCAPEVAAEEELKPGQVYFVMPRSKVKEPLSLHDMCGFAIKASSGLSLEDFHSSFRR